MNKKGENVQEFVDHTVKIWRLYVCFSSCFSLVKVELLGAGAVKFEMCVVIPFLHAEGQLVNLESHFSVFSTLKSTSEVSPRLKIQFSPIHTQRGGGISFWIFSDQFNRIPITGPACKKHITPASQIWRHQLLAAPFLLDRSMMRNIHKVFKFLQRGRTNLLSILPLVVYFSVA